MKIFLAAENYRKENKELINHNPSLAPTVPALSKEISKHDASALNDVKTSV